MVFLLSIFIVTKGAAIRPFFIPLQYTSKIRMSRIVRLLLRYQYIRYISTTLGDGGFCTFLGFTVCADHRHNNAVENTTHTVKTRENKKPRRAEGLTNASYHWYVEKTRFVSGILTYIYGIKRGVSPLVIP